MKNVLGLLLLLSSVMWGQKGFHTVSPDQPVPFNQVGDDYAYVRGHWVDAGKELSLTGPSVSLISCNRTMCNEEQANIVVMGNMFTISTGHVEYEVERWNSKEIVAATRPNEAASCHVRLTLKFDRVNKRVYWMQSLTEPANDPICAASEAKLELKDSTMWVK
jgi:hypothetical protein